MPRGLSVLAIAACSLEVEMYLYRETSLTLISVAISRGIYYNEQREKSYIALKMKPFRDGLDDPMFLKMPFYKSYLISK